MKHKVGITVTLVVCAGFIVLYALEPPRALMGLSRITRLLAIVVGSGFAFANWRRLDRDDPNRTGWFLLGAWLAWFLAGELALEAYRRLRGTAPPLPSVGDIFFLAGYGFLVAALVRFLTNWRASGFPLGNSRKQAMLALTVSLALAILNFVLLRPIALAPLPLGERLITILYPILDSVILVPTMILLGMVLHFRGGRVWAVWAALLAGIGFMGASDIAFAYVSSLRMSWVMPLLHVTVIFSYIFCALGAFEEWVLLSD